MTALAGQVRLGRTTRLPGPLTTAGWSMLLGCLIGYPCGVLLGYQPLIALTIGGSVLLAAAGALVAVRPRIELARTVHPDRVTVGQPSEGKLVARNLSGWPAPSFLVVDQVGGDRVELGVPMIAGAGRRTLRYSIPTRRRGRLRVGPLTIERRDPFGLFRRAQRLAGDSTLWVYPVVHPARPLPVGTVPDYEGRRAHTRGGTVTFSSLREYERGDDPRRIHWRTTARTGTLMVREHVDTTEPTTTIVLDTRRAALPPDGFERAVEVAASIAQAAVHAGRPATLLLPGEEVVGVRTMPLLDRLAAVQQSDDDSVTLLFTVERAIAGGALVVVTGAREPALVAKLGEQRRRFSPVVVVTIASTGATVLPVRRRPGMSIVAATSGADAVAAWDRMVLGDAE